ncbi:MAG: hypothetical protein FJ317_03165, partial [SAR202 cluster bacterium]|nr:hypothetical protein [SAR202 cluster bacterium]
MDIAMLVLPPGASAMVAKPFWGADALVPTSTVEEVIEFGMSPQAWYTETSATDLCRLIEKPPVRRDERLALTRVLEEPFVTFVSEWTMPPSVEQVPL